MGSVGGIDFYRLDTPVQMAGRHMRPFQHPGVDGVGFDDMGYYGEPHVIVGHAYYLLPGYRSTAIQNCTALAGQVVTVVEDTGEIWYYRRVLTVPKFGNMKVAILNGYLQYFLSVAFQVVATV